LIITAVGTEENVLYSESIVKVETKRDLFTVHTSSTGTRALAVSIRASSIRMHSGDIGSTEVLVEMIGTK